MLRRCLRQKLPSRIFTPRRSYSTAGAHGEEYGHEPRVRVLGPTVWCTTAIGAIYLGCAAYEVYQDAQAVKKDQSHRGWLPESSSGSSSLTFDQLEAARSTTSMRALHHNRSQGSGQPSPVVLAAIGTNVGIFAANKLVPSTWMNFAHVATSPRNYTLFTSMFGHAGLMHLGFNMYALMQFAPHVQQNRTFQGSDSHFAAFYLGSGLAASLGSHLSKVWPNAGLRHSAGLGASGAIMAILASFAMSNPNSQIGLLFVPGSLPAQQALMGLTAFELYGLFIGIRWISLGHAAHLTGLAVGAAYVHFDGRKRLWTPTRRLAFYSMQRFRMI